MKKPTEYQKFHSGSTSALLVWQGSQSILGVYKYMIAALIFVISMAAIIQFAIFSWRAVLLASSTEPLSAVMNSALDPITGNLSGRDFRAVSALNQICPDLNPKSRDLGHVQLYFRVLNFLNAVSRAILPACSHWSQREMAACTHYAAVIVDHRLQQNRALLADINSY